MRYFSTRSRQQSVSASEAILSGLAPDGGLYVPESLPKTDFSPWQGDSYQEIAIRLLSLYLTDFSPQAIESVVESCYGDKFDDPEVTPLHWLDDRHCVLELWHGPTLAFKDLALQCLPHLLTEAREIQGQRRRLLILTATSGDTGKAAMAGFSGREDALVAVFYPDRGVSDLQERQMLTDSGRNVAAFAVDGNFDDCQRSIKALMRTPSFLDHLEDLDLSLCSANSINIGRLLPQMVYYIFGYLKAVRNFGDPLSVVVPSGNAGNILAARYVREMGLPLDQIRLASNRNKVLYDFLTTGLYDSRRPLVPTSSPSMDILVASNMERYLHLLLKDERAVARLMDQLAREGYFHFDRSLFDLEAAWAGEEEVMAVIGETYRSTGYLLDPHTAVAVHGARRGGLVPPVLIAGTASPYKFAPSVLQALNLECPKDDRDQLDLIRALQKAPFPPGIKELLEREPGAKRRISTSEMAQAVDDLIGASQ